MLKHNNCRHRLPEYQSTQQPNDVKDASQQKLGPAVACSMVLHAHWGCMSGHRPFKLTCDVVAIPAACDGNVQIPHSRAPLQSLHCRQRDGCVGRLRTVRVAAGRSIAGLT